MGNPIQQGSGLGSLGYIKYGIEKHWGATITYIGGATATIVAGATTLTAINVNGILPGMYVYFLDGLLPGSNVEYPNLLESPIAVASVAGSVITLASPTTQSHYGPVSASLPTSGSLIQVAYQPSKGLYFESETLTSSLNYWSPGFIAASRVGTQQLLKGAEKVSGNIVMHIGPDWANDLLTGTFGFEQETFGTNPTGTGVLAASAAANSLTFNSTTTYTVGQTVQLDSTPNRECRVITVAATPVYTFTSPLRFAHASGAAVKVVVGPYTHQVVLANVLPSFTMEKFDAGDASFSGAAGASFATSFAYTGMYINKSQIKVDNKQGPKLTVSFEGQGETLIPATTPPSYPGTDAFVFSNVFLSLDGGTTQITNFGDVEVSVDNKLVMDTFLNNTTKVGIIKPGLRKIDGKYAIYFSDYNTYADYRDSNSKSFLMRFTQPATGYSITLSLTKVIYTKYDVKQPAGGLVMADVSFEAKLDTSTGSEGTIVIVDGNPLNYGF